MPSPGVIRFSIVGRAAHDTGLRRKALVSVVCGRCGDQNACSTVRLSFPPTPMAHRHRDVESACVCCAKQCAISLASHRMPPHDAFCRLTLTVFDAHTLYKKLHPLPATPFCPPLHAAVWWTTRSGRVVTLGWSDTTTPRRTIGLGTFSPLVALRKPTCDLVHRRCARCEARSLCMVCCRALVAAAATTCKQALATVVTGSGVIFTWLALLTAPLPTSCPDSRRCDPPQRGALSTRRGRRRRCGTFVQETSACGFRGSL